MKKWLTGLSIASSMLVLGACGGGDDSGEDTGNAENQQESQEQTASGSGEEGGQSAQSGGEGQQEMPEPDMEGVPDVVAEVNGEEVTKDELNKQVVDGIVSEELLIQETENRGIEASEDEVNKTLDYIVKQNQVESKDEFFTAMEEQGMKKDDVMSQLETQVKMDQ